MIKTFRVRNYKALRDVTLDLGRINVLIGPNDSGKTSVLEAIGALGRSADERLTEAFAGSWTGSALVTIGASSRTVGFEVRIEQGPHDLVYSISCDFDPSGREALVADETIALDGNDHRWSGRRATTYVSQRGRGDHPAPPQFDADRAAQLVYRSLHGVLSLHLNPRALAVPVAPDSRFRFRIHPSGFGLALCLDDILGSDRDRFAALESRMKRVFPNFRSIKLIQQRAYKSPPVDSTDIPLLSEAEGKGIYFQFSADPQPIAASQVSDGMLLVLAYLTVLHLPEPPRLLLIEEPENGIHPKRLADVIGVFRDLVREQSETQVVMTTHSPYVVDLFKPEEVHVCRMGEDRAVSVHRLSESKRVREQLDVFSLGEIWSAEGEERLTAEVAEPRVAEE